ncbi:MAG: hypothetical protein LBG58_13520 [Planctomycetaceae bacterium]|nr:hypothetical protein [Planctomycetaceae bacterium]
MAGVLAAEKVESPSYFRFPSAHRFSGAGTLPPQSSRAIAVLVKTIRRKVAYLLIIGLMINNRITTEELQKTITHQIQDRIFLIAHAE